jgi:hypothetical protein
MPPKSLYWAAFWTDDTKYKLNQSHKSAWCTACVRKKVNELKGNDLVALSSGNISEVQPSQQLHTEGMYFFHTYKSHEHLLTC